MAFLEMVPHAHLNGDFLKVVLYLDLFQLRLAGGCRLSFSGASFYSNRQAATAQARQQRCLDCTALAGGALLFALFGGGGGIIAVDGVAPSDGSSCRFGDGGNRSFGPLNWC